MLHLRRDFPHGGVPCVQSSGTMLSDAGVHVFSSNAPRVMDNEQKWLRALLLSSATGQHSS